MNKKGLDYTFYKFSVLTFLMMISAINYNVFIKPAQIVAGGANGIAVIMDIVFNYDSSLVILTVSIITLLVGLIFKEYEMIISAAYASLIYPVFVKIIGNSFGYLGVEAANPLLVAVFSGVISGVISGIICKINLSQGGLILISQSVSKKIHISVSLINTAINSSIILLGGFIFGLSNIMYGITFLIANKIAMDKILLGISQKKMFQIVTYKEDEVKNYISEALSAGYTTFNVVGTTNAHKTHKRTVIMSSVTNRDYFRLKEGIKEIDPNAFVLVTDAYQVKGGK